MNTNRNRATPVEVAEGDFKAEVLDSKRPVLVEFRVPGGRCCQAQDAVLKQVAVELAGRAKVVRINAAASRDLCSSYDIEVVPTLLYFVRGEALIQIVGSASRKEILSSIATLEQHSRNAGLRRERRPCAAHPSGKKASLCSLNQLPSARCPGTPRSGIGTTPTSSAWRRKPGRCHSSATSTTGTLRRRRWRGSRMADGSPAWN